MAINCTRPIGFVDQEAINGERYHFVLITTHLSLNKQTNKICPRHDKIILSPATQMPREAAPALPASTHGCPESLLLEFPDSKSRCLPFLQFIPKFHWHLNSVWCISGNQGKSKSHFALVVWDFISYVESKEIIIYAQ